MVDARRLQINGGAIGVAEEWMTHEAVVDDEAVAAVHMVNIAVNLGKGHFKDTSPLSYQSRN